MDIDIDFQTSFYPPTIISQLIPASMVKNEQLVKHPCGHYLQEMPIDNITGLAAIPYDEANELGFFKIDFLHLSLLDNFDSKQQIRELINTPPNWELLLNPVLTQNLFQLGKHSSLLVAVKPQSIQELADCVALIRPTKNHLIDKYIKDKNSIRPFIYRTNQDDKSAFKRSHAIAYALTIVLQLHLIELTLKKDK